MSPESWLGFERRVAVRFILEGRVQSILILVGVAAGVAVVAYISALMASLQVNLIEKTLGAQAHVTVTNAMRSAMFDRQRAHVDHVAELEPR